MSEVKKSTSERIEYRLDRIAELAGEISDAAWAADDLEFNLEQLTKLLKNSRTIIEDRDTLEATAERHRLALQEIDILLGGPGHERAGRDMGRDAVAAVRDLQRRATTVVQMRRDPDERGTA